MGEICRDSKDIHDGVFLVDFFFLFLFLPLGFFSRMKQRSGRRMYYVPACTSLSFGSLAMVVGSLLRLGR